MLPKDKDTKEFIDQALKKGLDIFVVEWWRGDGDDGLQHFHITTLNECLKNNRESLVANRPSGYSPIALAYNHEHAMEIIREAKEALGLIPSESP